MGVAWEEKNHSSPPEGILKAVGVESSRGPGRVLGCFLGCSPGFVCNT